MIEKFRNYSITEKIGDKPLRKVYKAYSLDDPTSRVILKIFDRGCLNQDYEYHEFLERCEFVKLIKHEHLVPILQMGIDEEQCYIVTPYISDVSLFQHLEQTKGGPRDLSSALEICIQLGKALSYLHSCGIAHANITPANILFSEEGKVMLTDFSLVGLIDESKPAYRSDRSAISYMAPEQDTRQRDERSDQYGLGCLGYELISGQPPFGILDPVQLLVSAATEVPPALSTLVPGITADVDQVFLRALAHDPDERYPGMDIFVEVLQAALASYQLAELVKSSLSASQSNEQGEKIGEDDATSNPVELASQEASATAVKGSTTSVQTSSPPAFPFRAGSAEHSRKFTHILALEQSQATTAAMSPVTFSPSLPAPASQKASLSAGAVNNKQAPLVRIPAGKPEIGRPRAVVLTSFLLTVVVLLLLSFYVMNGMLPTRQTPSPTPTGEYVAAPTNPIATRTQEPTVTPISTATPKLTQEPTATPVPPPTQVPTVKPTATPVPTVSPPLKNILTNGNFENSALFPWYFDAVNGTSGTATLDSSTKFEGNTSVRVDVNTVGSMSWYVQVGQETLSFTKDRKYTITFWAKASSEREAEILIQHDQDPWTEYFVLGFSLTTTWKEYVYTFTPTVTDDHVEFNFNLAQTKGSVWIDNVSITE